MSTLAGSIRPAADPVRLREMLSRGHLLGDLNSAEDVARELRIAAEETLGIGELALYLRQGRGTALVPVANREKEHCLPPLAIRVAREVRALTAVSRKSKGREWAWPLLVGDRLVGIALARFPENEELEDQPDLLGVLLGVAAHAFERALVLQGRDAERGVSQRRLSCLNRVQDLLRLLLGDWSLKEMLGQVAESVREGLGFRIVLIRTYDPEKDGYVARISRGLPREAAAEVHNRLVKPEDLEPLLAPRYRLSRSYFIGHASPVWETWQGWSFTPDLGRREEGEWHPDDCLLIPIENARGRRLGYFSVDDPVDRQPPSREAVQILEMFADLAAESLETATSRSGRKEEDAFANGAGG